MPLRPRAPIPFLVALLAGLLLAVLLPGRASAATPCWRQVLNDWTKHGAVTGSYPIHCYQQALKNLPEDVRDYSSAADDIFAAMQKQLRQRATLRHTQGVGSTPRSGITGGPGSTTTTATSAPNRSLYRRAIDNLGTNDANSLPVPLLILASLGGLLLLTAAGTAVTKRIRAGRAKPPGT